MAEKAEGLILRVTDFSESSRIVVWFTREFGRISTLAKGGRRLKGPFESALDLLAQCQIVFLRKSSSTLDLLTEARLVGRFRPPEKELSCLYAGYYLAELLLNLTEDYDPHPGLYESARLALTDFANSAKLPLAVLRWEWRVLDEIGQRPELEVCVGCGALLTEDRVFGVWISQGGLICAECQREDQQRLLVHGGTAKVLRTLAAEDDQAWRELSPTIQQLKEMRAMTTAIVSHAMGKRPTMLAYLK
jgi:DNA repair protein RecO (recombination protein O)